MRRHTCFALPPLSLPHCLSRPLHRSHLLRRLYHPRHQHQHQKAQKVLGREAAPLACLRHQRARARGAQAAEEHRHGPVERAHTLIHEGVLRQLVGCCKRGWKRGIAGRVRRVAWTPLPPLAALLTRLAHTSPMLNARQECSDTSMSSRSSEGGSDSPSVTSSTPAMREAARVWMGGLTCFAQPCEHQHRLHAHTRSAHSMTQMPVGPAAPSPPHPLARSPNLASHPSSHGAGGGQPLAKAGASLGRSRCTP